MEHPASTLRDRIPAAAALAGPVLAGLGYLAAFGAPQSYLIVNGGALVAAIVVALSCPALRRLHARRALSLFLLVLLFVPLASGPEISGVSRWLPLGPFMLHAGMLALPALVVLATHDRDYTAPWLLGALLAAFLQPDAATGFAVTFAAIGLHHVTRDWKIGVVAIIGFFATLVMAMRGELPPQPFVERIFAELLVAAPFAAAGLFAALAAGFFLILLASPAPRSQRYALAGCLFGFALMALLSHYPTPLLGYGAAPILGFGLALGLAGDRSEP